MLQGRSQIITHDEIITLFRDEKKPVYIDGKITHLPKTKYEFKGTVQPLQGMQLLIVPEADRFKEQFYVWSEFQMQINDEIVRCKVNYTIQQIELWGSYSRARMVRIDVGADRSPVTEAGGR